MTFSELFIDVKLLPGDGYGLFQLLCIGATYGYILCVASNMISDGSELLLLVPAAAGLVGSVVLPVLGAVPDGCIVLFSGLGENAQDTLNVGVGALAGSTIMLLTVPWFLSIMGGRVNIDSSTKLARYKSPKLSPLKAWSLTESGVSIDPSVRNGAVLMLISACPFLVLQTPGLYYANMSLAQQAIGESLWSLLGFFLCLASFVGYMLYQYAISDDTNSPANDLREEVLLTSIAENKITLMAVIHSELAAAGARGSGMDDHLDPKNSLNSSSALSFQSETSPMRPSVLPQKVLHRLEKLLGPFFKRYDTDSSGLLDLAELSFVLRDLGEKNMEQAREMQRVFGASLVS